MSHVRPSVLPLSFSVERLLQPTAIGIMGGKGSSSLSSTGGSLGSPTSDYDSTPPSSPDSSCNFTDLQERRRSIEGQFVINTSSFATLPCIPVSALRWNPAALSPQTPVAAVPGGWGICSPMVPVAPSRPTATAVSIVPPATVFQKRSSLSSSFRSNRQKCKQMHCNDACIHAVCV